MSIKARIEKLEMLMQPKAVLRFVLSEAEVTTEKGIVWVIFEI